MNAVDRIASVIPSAPPTPAALRDCKIVAHRGEHDNTRVLENTLQSFRDARTAGVWGLECDIRWTRDLVPVIHHDAGCERLFGDPARLGSMDFDELRDRFPLIPTLGEVLSEFGGDRHLMLEVKEEHFPEPARQQQILQRMLDGLSPGEDFHILMLEPALARHVAFIPRRYCILVAQTNIVRLSRAALAGEFGGLCGHYLLLNPRMQRRHRDAGQMTGTGFIASANVLFRELNRGMEWIFSNDAVHIQQIRDRALAQSN